MFEHFDLMDFGQTMVILVIAITLHEAGHAFTADWCGDDTPRSQGRLTINPMDHLEPIGSIMMVFSSITGFGIGWGRAVITHPMSFKHPRWDRLKVAIAGPAANLLQVIVFTIAIRACLALHPHWMTDFQYDFLAKAIQINVGLIFFNLIPIPPLDGSKVLSTLLPLPAAQTYDRMMSSFGLFLIILLVATPITSYIVADPAVNITNMLTGF